MIWKAIVLVTLVFLGLYLLILIMRRFISIGKGESADRFFSLYKNVHDAVSAIGGVVEEYYRRTEKIHGAADYKKRIIVDSALKFSRKKLDEISPKEQFLLVLREKAEKAHRALNRAKEIAEKSGSDELITQVEKCRETFEQILASGENTTISDALRTIATVTKQANTIAEMEIEETSNQEKTHYEILGIYSDASIEQISKTYRNLAAKFHPDQFTWATEEFKAEMEEKMKRVNEAYEVLSNSEKRREYDATMGGA